MPMKHRLFLLIVLLVAFPALALTGVDVLVIDGGNEIDFEAGATEGFPRLAQSTTPPAAECNEAGESGRLYMDTDSVVGSKLQVCSGAAGWEDMFTGGGFMKESDYVTILGYPYVDYSVYSTAIDANNDGIPEFACPSAFVCEFDGNTDGVIDQTLTNLASSYFQGSANPFTISQSTTEVTGVGYQLRMSDGIGVGNPTSDVVTTGGSACIGRSTATNEDRLFEDKDCDFKTTTTPEAGEGYLTDRIARLTADHTIASTTATEVTGLRLTLDAGTYAVSYYILAQSSSTTVGLAYGINYTGTLTTLSCVRSYPSDGTAAATGVLDDAANTNTGQLMEHMTTQTASTTAPNLGPNTGVATASTNTLERVECVVVVTTTATLAFWHSSETATNTSVMANSVVKATQFP